MSNGGDMEYILWRYRNLSAITHVEDQKTAQMESKLGSFLNLCEFGNKDNPLGTIVFIYAVGGALFNCLPPPTPPLFYPLWEVSGW